MAGTKPQLETSLIPVERIASRICLVRGKKVMLDAELAELYGVLTKNLNLAVRRNERRFPEDFMFQLTSEETGRGGRRYLPFAFTEQGVAMLSSVLKSDRAAQVNVMIMRTFVRIREVLATNEELARKVALHDRQIAVLVEQVQHILAPTPAKKKPIGFVASKA